MAVMSLKPLTKSSSDSKRYTPNLSEKFFNSVLKKVYQDVKSEIPDAVTSDAVAFGVGVVLGSVGKQFEKRKVSSIVSALSYAYLLAFGRALVILFQGNRISFISQNNFIVLT